MKYTTGHDAIIHTIKYTTGHSAIISYGSLHTPQTKFKQRQLFNNYCSRIFAVKDLMLEGEVLYREGSYDDAFATLRAAVALDDGECITQ